MYFSNCGFMAIWNWIFTFLLLMFCFNCVNYFELNTSKCILVYWNKNWLLISSEQEMVPNQQLQTQTVTIVKGVAIDSVPTQVKDFQNNEYVFFSLKTLAANVFTFFSNVWLKIASQTNSKNVRFQILFVNQAGFFLYFLTIVCLLKTYNADFHLFY